MSNDELDVVKWRSRIRQSGPEAWRRERTHFASVLIGDVSSDGRSDLLVGRSRKELRVFLGVPGADLFARRSQRVAVAMPKDEETTWLVDLNKDDKQDSSCITGLPPSRIG